MVIAKNNYYHKTFLDYSNGERLICSIKHCEKQLPLKWRSFRERSNFPHFETSDLEFEVSKSSIWKHTTSWCDKGVFFLSIIFCNFDDRLSSNFHRFVILCECWDTPTVKTSLWQLPIVSSVFNWRYMIGYDSWIIGNKNYWLQAYSIFLKCKAFWETFLL